MIFAPDRVKAMSSQRIRELIDLGAKPTPAGGLALSVQPHEIRGQNLAASAVKFGKSMTTWAWSGFKVSAQAYDQRMAVCRACEFWEEHSRLGYGKCQKCGCGRAKQWLPHESCPIGKWGQEPVS